MGRLIDREKLIAEYDRVHIGPPGGARKLMEEAEEVPAIPVDWIKAQIPDSTEFFAVVTAIILQHLIDLYREEKDNGKTE
jgi:hypothetical protein